MIRRSHFGSVGGVQFGQSLRRAHVGPGTAVVFAGDPAGPHRRAQQRRQLEARRLQFGTGHGAHAVVPARQQRVSRIACDLLGFAETQ